MFRMEGIPETMLITLWAKREESKRKNGLFQDPKVEEIFEILQKEYDFSIFTKATKSQLGVAVRTFVMDEVVRDFVASRSRPVVVNLGAGLDTRYLRLGESKIEKWYDLDLPEAIALRRRFLPENEKNLFIEASMFDTSWMGGVEGDGKNVLILAEGLLMYFPEEELRPFFNALIERFPGGAMVFDTVPPFIVGREKMHDSVKLMEKRVPFRWGVQYPEKELESWNPSLRFTKKWNYYDYCKKRWGLFWYVHKIPFVGKNSMCWIVRLDMAEKPTVIV